MEKETKLNFENAIIQIEQIIQGIETNELDLETALTQYKNGMELVKFCQDKLRDIEQKVKLLDQETNTLKDFKAE